MGLRVRPPAAGLSDGPYPELLLREGWQVYNTSRAAITVEEAIANVDDDVVAIMPDVVVLQFGVVEVCLRRSVRWIHNYPIINYYNNTHLGRRYVPIKSRWRWTHWLCAWLNKAISVTATKIGVQWQWISNERFIEAIEFLVRLLLKETRATVLVMGISPLSRRVERLLNGSSECIQAANHALADSCTALGPRVYFVDVERLIGDERVEELVPDGVHFSADGHKLVSGLLSVLFERIERERCGEPS